MGPVIHFQQLHHLVKNWVELERANNNVCQTQTATKYSNKSYVLKNEQIFDMDVVLKKNNFVIIDGPLRRQYGIYLTQCWRKAIQ